MARRFLQLLALAFAALLGAACGPPPAPAPPAKPTPTASEEAPSFHLDKAALRERGIAAKQLAKIDASAFRYSRMLARQFEARTCSSFRDLRWSLPIVAVHGDAHIEQFVVTSDTYGVEDFDHAGYGPAVVDVVRYAASIHLASRELAFACDPNQAVERFFAAYRAALDKPPQRNRPPSVVERLRKRAPQERAAWLAWVDRQMIPLQAEDDALARRTWSKFNDLQRTVRPDRVASFFDIVQVGELKMGFGSVLERKVLVKVRGPSADPLDDVVLEARAGEERSASSCVWRPDHGAALHVLTFMALIGPRMPEVLGYVGLADQPSKRPFWVQSWNPGYVELSLEDVKTQGELEDVAEDAARQLAGHFRTRYPEQLGVYQRYAQLQGFDLVRERAITLSIALAREVVSEWERFRTTP